MTIADSIKLTTLPFGYSEHHINYAGTITLSAETYRRVVTEIGASMAEHGAERLLVVNCHGGNVEPIALAADRVERDHDLPVHVVHWTDYAEEALTAEFGVRGDDWGHAGPHETSVIELFRPDLVHEGRKEPQVGRANYETKVRRYFDDITRQGGMGEPGDSDAEFISDVVTETTARILRELEADIEKYSIE